MFSQKPNKVVGLKIHLFIMSPPELTHIQHCSWSSCCLHFVLCLTALHTCKHNALCCSGSTLCCLTSVYLYPQGQSNGRKGRAGIWTWTSAQVYALLLSPLRKVRTSSSVLLHFPMGKQTDWRQTVRSTLQTDTPVWAAGLSLSLSTHTGAFCCSLVRWGPLD